MSSPSPFGRPDAPPPPPGATARGPKGRSGPGPGAGRPPSPSGPGGPPPGAGSRPGRPGSGPRGALGPDSSGGIGTATRFDDGGGAGWFDPLDPLSEIDGEPTPALLAAKAEPLTRPRSNRPAKRPQRSNRPAARPGQKPAGPQARRGGRRKPKEPSKILLVLGVIVVLASGLGAAYLFTRGSDGEQAATGTTTPSSTPATAATGQDATDPSTTSTTAVAAGPDSGKPPAVLFDEAATGPISAGTPYTIGVANGPADAQYQLTVDGTAQGEPAAELAPVTFEPGRHLLEISVITPTATTPLPAALVYAVGPPPAEVTYAANLSSVSITDPAEGWAEAISRFEAFSVDHPNLQLLPPDALPGLPEGYWILFVPGFASAEEATAYCEQHQLQVPEQCFNRKLDPAGG